MAIVRIQRAPEEQAAQVRSFDWLFPPPAATAAISVVQHNSTTGAATTASLAFTGSVTAGNLIAVCVSTYAGNTISGVSDSASNSYTLAVAKNPGTTGSPAQASIYYAVAASSGPLTITASFGGTNSTHLHIYEVSGATQLDQTGSNYQSSTTTAATVSTASATAHASEYVLAFFATNNEAGTWTAGTGYTDLESSPNSGHGTSASSEDVIVSSAGAQTATATLSISDVITGVIATFYSTAGTTSLSLGDTYSLIDKLIQALSRSWPDSYGSADRAALAVTLPLPHDTFSPSDGLKAQIGKPLADLYSAADGVARQIAKRLVDAYGAGDTILRTVGRNVADAFSAIADKTNRALSRQWKETAAAADAVLRSVSRAFSDFGSAADTALRSVFRALTDSASATDALTFVYTRFLALAESFSGVSDSLGRAISKRWVDTLSVTDTFSRAIAKTVAETYSATENFVLAIGRKLSDAVAPGDTIARLFTKMLALADAFSGISDGIARSIAKQWADAGSAADSILRSIHRAFPDTASVTDALSRVSTRLLALADAFGGIADSLTQKLTKQWADTVAIADRVSQALFRSWVDTASSTDSLTRAIGRKLADLLSPTDAITRIRTVLLALGDTFSSLADRIAIGMSQTWIEMAIASESLHKAIGKSWGDAITIADSLGRAIQKLWGDAVSVTDSFTLLRNGFVLLLADTFTATDSLGRAVALRFTELATVSESLLNALVGKARRWLVQAIQRLWGVTGDSVRAWTVSPMVRTWQIVEGAMIYTEKDPNATEDFQLDWSPVLSPTSDTIATSAWTVPTGLTLVSSTTTTTSATARLAGGTLGQIYTVANVVTLASGQVKAENLRITIQRA